MLLLQVKHFLATAFIIGLTSGCRHREEVYKPASDPIFKVHLNFPIVPTGLEKTHTMNAQTLKFLSCGTTSYIGLVVDPDKNDIFTDIYCEKRNLILHSYSIGR